MGERLANMATLRASLQNFDKDFSVNELGVELARVFMNEASHGAGHRMLAADGLGRRKLIESLEEKLSSESCTYAKVSLQEDGCSFYSECYAIASPVSDVEVCSRGAALVYCWGATWQRVQPSQALVLIPPRCQFGHCHLHHQRMPLASGVASALDSSKKHG